MADIATQTRQQAIAYQKALTNSAYLQTLANRRRGQIAQVAKTNLAKPPISHHHGLIGSIFHDVTHEASLATTQVADALVHTIPGLYELAKAGVLDTRDLALHGDVTPERLGGIGKSYVQNVYQDVTHPLRRPGYLLLDAASLYGGGAGIAGRASRAAEAFSRAKAGLAQRVAEEPHTLARHPLLKGYDELKGKAVGKKAKAILAAQHQQRFESFPYVAPTPARVRDVLIGKVRFKGKQFFPEATARAERARAAKDLPIQIHQKEMGPDTVGQIAVSARHRKLQFGLIRTPADFFKEGLLPKGAKGHIFTIEHRGADYEHWEPLTYKPTPEEIAQATAEGVEPKNIIHQGAPLMLPVKAEDYAGAMKIFEQTVHEWMQGKSRYDLSIVKSSSSKAAAKKLGLVQSGGYAKEAELALVKALGEKGETFDPKNLPPGLQGIGVEKMYEQFTPDEIAYLFKHQRLSEAAAQHPVGSAERAALEKERGPTIAFRDVSSTPAQRTRAVKDLIPYVARGGKKIKGKVEGIKKGDVRGAAQILGSTEASAQGRLAAAARAVEKAAKEGRLGHKEFQLTPEHRAQVAARRAGVVRPPEEVIPEARSVRLVKKELPTEEVSPEERAREAAHPEPATGPDRAYINWEREFRIAPIKSADFKKLVQEGREEFNLTDKEIVDIRKNPREPALMAKEKARLEAEKPKAVYTEEEAARIAKASKPAAEAPKEAPGTAKKLKSAGAAELASQLEPVAKEAEAAPKVAKPRQPKAKVEVKMTLPDGSEYTAVFDKGKVPQKWQGHLMRKPTYGTDLQGAKFSRRELPAEAPKGKAAPAVKSEPAAEAKPAAAPLELPAEQALTEEEKVSFAKAIKEAPEAGRLTTLTNAKMGSGYTAWEKDFAEAAKKTPLGAKEPSVQFRDLVQEGKDAFGLKKKELDLLHQKAHEAPVTVKEVTGGKIGGKGSRLQRASNALQFAQKRGTAEEVAAAQKEVDAARAEADLVKKGTAAEKPKPINLGKAAEPEQQAKVITDEIKKDEMREGVRKEGTGQRAMGTNPRLLDPHVPPDKVSALRKALHGSIRAGKSENDQLQLFRSHLGDKAGTEAYNNWKEAVKADRARRSPKTDENGTSRISGGSGTEPVPVNNFEAMITATKAFFKPALRERMLLAPTEHTKELPLTRSVFGFKQDITGHYSYPLSQALSVRALQKGGIGLARRLAGEIQPEAKLVGGGKEILNKGRQQIVAGKVLKTEPTLVEPKNRLYKFGKAVGLDKKAVQYLTHKRRQTLERNDTIVRAVDLAERAASFNDNDLRQKFLSDQIKKLTSEKDDTRLARNLDTLNQLASMGVLYMKGPAFYIPNFVGQGTVFASDAIWNPFKAIKALHLMSKVQEKSPLGSELVMAGVGHGAASMVRAEAGTRGIGGRIIRTAHGKLAQTYGEGFVVPGGKYKGKRITPGVDRQFRAGAVGLEMMRQGFDTPEKVMALIKNPYRRGRLIDILDRANENAVGFNKMSHFERQYLTRFVFFYPWIHGASRYSVRFMMHHPAQTAAYIGAARYAQGVQAKVLPPLPSYLQGVIRGPNIKLPFIGNLGTENVPGLGKVPRTYNTQSTTVLGTLGDVVNTIGANVLSGDVKSSQQLSQVLNPTASIALEGITRTDPLTGRTFPAGTTFPGIVKQELGQMAAPIKYAQDWQKANQFKAGTKPTEQVLLPRGRADVAGRFLTGLGPTPLNPKESASRAFAERAAISDRVQREYQKMVRDRKTWVDTLVGLGYLKAGQTLPDNLKLAFVQRAARQANQAAWEVRTGQRLDTLGRFTADVNLAVRQKKITAAQGNTLLTQVARYGSDTMVEKIYRKFRQAVFGPDVISAYKTAINKALDAQGKAKLTVP